MWSLLHGPTKAELTEGSGDKNKSWGVSVEVLPERDDIASWKGNAK